MALMLQPLRLANPKQESVWYTTQYYKPKALLSNVYLRILAAANTAHIPLRVSSAHN